MKSSTVTSESSARSSDEAKYRGVRLRKWGKWVSEIRLPNSRERIWLGSYDSAEKAARAFDAALFCLRGNTANFNFPDQPPNIPGGTDLHPSQIQAVASEFANSYPLSISTSSSQDQLQDHDPNVSNNNNNSYYTSTTMDIDVASSLESSFVMDQDDYSINNNSIPDFGIFPGFDDYFMPIQPPLTDNYYSEEVNYEGFYSQDPCLLWNF